MTLLVFSPFFFGCCHNNPGLTVLSSGFGQALPVTVKKLSYVESLIRFAEMRMDRHITDGSYVFR